MPRLPLRPALLVGVLALGLVGGGAARAQGAPDTSAPAAFDSTLAARLAVIHARYHHARYQDGRMAWMQTVRNFAGRAPDSPPA